MPSPRVDLAEWTKLIPESEIRRLLRYKVKYYFAGGKPGVIPTGAFPMILMRLALRELEDVFSGKETEVIEDYNYGPTDGLPDVRRTLANLLRERDSINLDKEEGWKEVVVTTGSQQMIYLALDVLLNPGDIVIVPAPVYLGFVNVVTKLYGNTIAVPGDEDGIIPEYVEDSIRKAERELGRKPKLIYVVPDSDNPSGTTLPESRRRKLLEIAKENGVYLLEDAAYREIQFRGERLKPIRAFDGDGSTVIYMRTTSKEVSVLRVGYNLMPAEIREEVVKAKGYYDLCTPTITQKMAKLYYELYFNQFIEKVREGYKRRYEAMAKAIDESFPDGKRTDPTGGFFIWWESSDKDFDSKKFLEEVAIPNDVLYVPGEAFYPLKGYIYDPADGKLLDVTKRIPKNGMRLGYSYNDPSTIDEGIRRLGSLLSNRV
ncbi:MAG: PLP-dependent aminotransferase family protein [Candidatus Korarchaeum sp.]